jgi:hypothetical protein
MALSDMSYHLGLHKIMDKWFGRTPISMSLAEEVKLLESLLPAILEEPAKAEAAEKTQLELAAQAKEAAKKALDAELEKALDAELKKELLDEKVNNEYVSLINKLNIELANVPVSVEKLKTKEDIKNATLNGNNLLDSLRLLASIANTSIANTSIANKKSNLVDTFKLVEEAVYVSEQSKLSTRRTYTSKALAVALPQYISALKASESALKASELAEKILQETKSAQSVALKSYSEASKEALDADNYTAKVDLRHQLRLKLLSNANKTGGGTRRKRKTGRRKNKRTNRKK